MKKFSTEDLIASVRRRVALTDDVGSEGKTDQDIIDVLDEVMLDEIIPSILELNEEFFVRTLTRTIDSSTNRYSLPHRAVGNNLRDVFFQNGSAKEFLDPVHREYLPFYGSTAVAVPRGFYIEGDALILVPPGNGGTMKISFFWRPGQLVKAANYRKVTTVDPGTNTITLDSDVPTTWDTSTTFDVHSQESGAEVRVYDYAATVVSGTTITFYSAIDGSVDSTYAIQENDYVCVAETAAIPSIPRDAHPALAQAAACRLLESDGDSEMLKIARETLARQLRNFKPLMDTRVDGKPKRIIPRRSLIWAQRRTGGWR